MLAGCEAVALPSMTNESCLYSGCRAGMPQTTTNQDGLLLEMCLLLTRLIRTTVYQSQRDNVLSFPAAHEPGSNARVAEWLKVIGDGPSWPIQRRYSVFLMGSLSRVRIPPLAFIPGCPLSRAPLPRWHRAGAKNRPQWGTVRGKK